MLVVHGLVLTAHTAGGYERYYGAGPGQTDSLGLPRQSTAAVGTVTARRQEFVGEKLSAARK